MRWDPAKYTQFANYRDRPFFDLTARIRCESPRRVIDLGCGPGTLTASLAARWPNAEVVGLDNSPEMIRSASEMEDAPANLRFETVDLRTWEPGPQDEVVVSNAVLQWVEGHDELLRRWAGQLPAGAWLAFQVPGNFAAPSHAIMRELARSEDFVSQLDGVLRHGDTVADPTDYLELLLDCGWDAEAWETSYMQLLQGEDPVLEWVRGTGLRPVLHALPPERAELFEVRYSTLLREAYPKGPHGTVFPFRRIFAVGRNPSATA